MTWVQAAFLGIVQGLTEFLPVSSSGHLVLFQTLLGFEDPLVAFDVVLHLGTLIAVFIYFWKDLMTMTVQTLRFIFEAPFAKNKDAVLDQYPHALTAGFVILSTIPTAAMGFIFKDTVEYFFGSILVVGIAWMVLGIVLISTRTHMTGGRPLSEMNHRDAFVIGIAQGIALIPGLSRSGSTIIAGLYAGIDKKDAARFSFFLSIPAILGAAVLQLKDQVNFFELNPEVTLAGFASALITGYLSIAFLMKIISKRRFHWFGVYTLILGAATLIYFRFFS